jgi:hypothetical protein
MWGSNPPAAAAGDTRRTLTRKFAAFMRWLHIYLSMFGLATLLFFSLTGVTLNHPEWFQAGPGSTAESQGRMRPEWLRAEPRDSRSTDRAGEAASGSVKKLEIVEYLRSTHGVRGALADFQVDDQECVVSFKGAGYAADAFIDRDSGDYRITEIRHGPIAVLNDLHKGRDTGPIWSWVIDISAGMLSFASLTGLVLLLYIKRRRRRGLLTGILGTLALAAIAYYLVP